MIDGFAPIFDENSEILILGSFPSVASRDEGFYYGNKRNRFWNLLRSYFGENFKDDAESKTRFLLSKKIALWDIVDACEIEGSSDSSIRNPKVVDLSVVLNASKVKRIFFNGAKSYELYKKNYDYRLETVRLPSTSPANAKFNEQEWFARFKEAGL